MAADAAHVGKLRDDLLGRLREVGGLHVNGAEPRLPGNLNVSFDGVDGEALAIRLKDSVAVSTGSACTAASLEPSHVLQAIGLPIRRAEGALRFGLGRSTTAEQVAAAARMVVDAVTALRAAASRRAA
jgi:cysteine desulfurase